ncbi:MAG: MarP family serine protease [Dermatophilaceae bacterium]
MTFSFVLDMVLLLLLAGYAWSGWRQGLITAVLGLVGLVGGAVVTVRVVPDLLEDRLGVARGTAASAVVVVVLVVLVAVTVQSLMLLLAARVRDAVRLPAARAVDSFLGLVAVLTASVLVLWVVAGVVRTSGPPGAREAVARSGVVTAVDSLVPASAARVVDDVTQALDRQGFPQVFDGLGPEPIAAVDAPDAALVDDPEVRVALRSVIRVRADSRRCDTARVGSGWVGAAGYVVTNAHVVAGSQSVRVSVGGRGRERAARVVVFDPDRDVAVLAVPGLTAAALARGDELPAGASAVVAGCPGDDGLTVRSARVRDVIRARGADIYGDSGTTREIYSLRAQVRQGASGGPMVDTDGRVVGMVFATSLDDPDTGYALTLDEMAPVLRNGLAATGQVPTGRCSET